MFLIITFLVYLTAQGQDVFLSSQSSSLNDSSGILFNKYLSSPDRAEEKISELIELYRKDEIENDLTSAFEKIQVALVLEKHLDHPTVIAFTLNEYIADLLNGSNASYALEFYRRATSILNSLPELTGFRKFRFYSVLAGVHLEMGEPDSAYFYYQKAIPESKLDSYTAEASALNNLGVFFYKEGQNDSAWIYFQNALVKMGKKENEIGLYCSIRDNIAQLDEFDGHYSEAIKTFLFNDSVYLTRQLHYQYIANKVRLLKAWEKINEPTVPYQIQKLNEYIKENATRENKNDILDFYRFANQYYFTHDQKLLQDLYLGKYIKFRDSLEKESLKQINLISGSLLEIQLANFKSEIRSHQLLTERNQLQLRIAKFTVITTSLGSLLIILILFLYMRKRKIEHQASKQMADAALQREELEHRLVQQALELKKHDLTNVVLHNTQIYDSNQKIIERLEEISQQKTNLDQHIRSLLIDLQGQNQVSDRSINLQANIESVNEEFYENLKKRYPDLSKSEAELCGYIRINLSSKDISILKNVEADSVKKSKTRLRRKLGISPDADIYEFVRQI